MYISGITQHRENSENYLKYFPVLKIQGNFKFGKIQGLFMPSFQI